METEKDFVNRECSKCIYEHISTDLCHIVKRMDGSWYCPNQKYKEIEIEIPIITK